MPEKRRTEYTRAELVGVYPVVIGKERIPSFVMLIEGMDWGGRVLPIFIGVSEAIAIDRAIKGLRLERPMTHDLIVNILDELEVRVEKITIDALLENSIYTATIVLSREENGKTQHYYIDARPSDSVAIAVRTGAPIFVASHLRKYAKDQSELLFTDEG